jgi:NAD(P)-dependent dehydrogenase (short-subunit alcohol dehydrogenase family)
MLPQPKIKANVCAGAAAVKSIVDDVPAAAGKIEVLLVDVSNDASCTAAAATLQAKGVVLYGLVNNAGGHVSITCAAIKVMCQACQPKVPALAVKMLIPQRTRGRDFSVSSC